MKRRVVLVACAVALLAASCGGKTPASSPESTATNSPAAAAKADGLPELTDIRQLQAAFDAHPGVPRLVILLSPT
jgi:hypothetical protein